MKKLVFVIAIAMIAACAGILGLRKANTGVFPHRAHVIAGVACTRCHANVADGAGDVRLRWSL